ncbi:hypothetical protein HZS_924, partial [Henneguya salminicola]
LKYCELNSCQNNGVNKLIFNKKKSFYTCTCECKSMYFGKLCQYQYRCKNCKNNMCIRNNTCLSCKSESEGDYCKYRKSDRFKMCLNNGTIKIHKKTIECDCKPNIYGKYCEINCSDICLSKNCVMKANLFVICQLRSVQLLSQFR